MDYSGLAANIALATKALRKAGVTHEVLALQGEIALPFRPMDGLYTFAIGGLTPPLVRNRVTSSGVENWIEINIHDLVISGHVRVTINPHGVVSMEAVTIWGGTDYYQTTQKALEIASERDHAEVWDFTADDVAMA